MDASRTVAAAGAGRGDPQSDAIAADADGPMRHAAVVVAGPRGFNGLHFLEPSYLMVHRLKLREPRSRGIFVARMNRTLGSLDLAAVGGACDRTDRTRASTRRPASRAR